MFRTYIITNQKQSSVLKIYEYNELGLLVFKNQWVFYCFWCRKLNESIFSSLASNVLIIYSLNDYEPFRPYRSSAPKVILTKTMTRYSNCSLPAGQTPLENITGFLYIWMFRTYMMAITNQKQSSVLKIYEYNELGLLVFKNQWVFYYFWCRKLNESIFSSFGI